MTTESLYRLHTDALDEITLLRIADRIHETNPNQQVYVYPIEKHSEGRERDYGAD